VNIDLVELAASALGELRDEVVFVGGATVELWISDPGAPEFRPTDDVDVVVEVSTRAGYRSFEERLEQREFRHDQESGVICRFRHRPTTLVLDVMPRDPAILGFENRWQEEAVDHSVARELPSHTVIRVIPPVYLLATKLEAFRTRGRGDFLGSRDFNDVVVLIDGRPELVDEVRAAPDSLQRYIASELKRLLDDPRFEGGISGALLPDEASQARRHQVVMPRIQELIEIGS